MNRSAILGIFCLGLIGSIAAQEPRTENTWTRGKDFTPAPTKIETMNGLAGRWVGEAMGGTTEEIWSPPDAGEMIGMFRFIKDGKTSFYELMTISPS